MTEDSTSGALCAARTSRDRLCINPAKGGPFCVGHNPRNQCGQPTRIHGATCKRMQMGDTGRCSYHQRA